MKKITFLCMICLTSLGFSQNLPFPQHYVYTAVSIKPNNHTQAQLDSVVKDFYGNWKARYFRNTCNPNQYFVWFGDEDPTINSVSEGQGYGMMIAAYMAGYDPNAKTIYDGLYNYYKAHLDSISFELMAWEQNTSCVDTGGADDATDGDMDIAYSLLLADKQWGSTGTINYLQEAKNIIDSLMVYVINHNKYSTELGDWVTPADTTNYYATRPSDFMPDHFRAFQIATSDSKWNNVINECYSIVNTIQANNSPTTWLMPDFVVSCNRTPKPAKANFLEGPYDGNYYYNSCRVPWRLTTDYLIAGEARAKTAVDKINTWLKSSTSNVPANILSGFYLNGTNLPGNNYPDPSFIGPFAVGAMSSNTNQTWLNGVYDYLVAQSFDSNTYFPNTLKMLNLIVISGNYWPPYTITGDNNITATETHFTIYPIPARNNVTISFETSKAQHLQIIISNAFGQVVDEILNGNLSSGKHLQVYNTGNLASGIYFVTLFSESSSITRKLMISR
jgi:endo-1,4-beta-D-glucanase Y